MNLNHNGHSFIYNESYRAYECHACNLSMISSHVGGHYLYMIYSKTFYFGTIVDSEIDKIISCNEVIIKNLLE